MNRKRKQRPDPIGVTSGEYQNLRWFVDGALAGAVMLIGVLVGYVMTLFF